MTSQTANRTFEQDAELLTEILAEVVASSEGESAIDLHRSAVAFARRARDGDPAAPEELQALVDGLSPRMTELLVRSLTRWFQLINLAEDNDRVRHIRASESAAAPAPRSGSIREAVGQLAEYAGSSERLTELLDSVKIDLVMTAHPTEARRRGDRGLAGAQAPYAIVVLGQVDQLEPARERAHEQLSHARRESIDQGLKLFGRARVAVPRTNCQGNRAAVKVDHRFALAAGDDFGEDLGQQIGILLKIAVGGLAHHRQGACHKWGPRRLYSGRISAPV